MASLRDTLQAIYDARGLLTPEIVVNEARAAAHPLHAHFEWDDAAAGEAWRREQAAQLIRSVRVKYADAPSGPKDVRAFVAMPQADSRAQHYVPVVAVLEDPIQRAILLRDMEREWKAFQARYSHMAEFAALISASVADKVA